MSRTYATEAELAKWLGLGDTAADAPEGAARLLRDASLEIDEMLFTAHYEVNEDDMPVNKRVRDALRDATCAQAAHRDEYGSETEILTGDEPVSLGPLALGGRRGSSKTEHSVPVHSPQARRILRLAGLIPGGITDG